MPFDTEFSRFQERPHRKHGELLVGNPPDGIHRLLVLSKRWDPAVKVREYPQVMTHSNGVPSQSTVHQVGTVTHN